MILPSQLFSALNHAGLNQPVLAAVLLGIYPQLSFCNGNINPIKPFFTHLKGINSRISKVTSSLKNDLVCNRTVC